MEKRDFLIYCHTNKINNKKYVGQTIDLKRRIGLNGSGYLTKNKKGEYSQQVFARAILKYGWDNFETEILYQGLTEDEANELEKKTIKELNSLVTGWGYNIREGGSNSHLSEETKKKLSIAHSKENLSDEARRNIAKGQMGKKHSEDTKRKMSEKRKGPNHPMYGKHRTKETKEKLSRYNIENNMGYKKGKENPRSNPVICLETLEKFESCREADKYYNPNPNSKFGNNVANAVNGRRKTAYGLHFMSLEEYNNKNK